MCGNLISLKRKNAEYCSNKCKQKNHKLVTDKAKLKSGPYGNGKLNVPGGGK